VKGDEIELLFAIRFYLKQRTEETAIHSKAPSHSSEGSGLLRNIGAAYLLS